MASDMSLKGKLNRALTRKLPIKRVRGRLERAVASITFDDFPKSARTVAGPILERHGAKATYYTAGGMCGSTVEGIEQYDLADLRAVHAAGHEIACHTFSHRAAPTLSNAVLEEETARNETFLTALLPGLRLSSFAYPYGEASPRSKLWYSRRFASSRGIRAGLNAGGIDLAELESVPLEHRRWSPALIEDWVARAVAARSWLTIFTHDIDDAPSPYGATPAMLEHLLETLRSAGVEVLPVKHAMARAVFGEH